jgi:hypothetical protein
LKKPNSVKKRNVTGAMIGAIVAVAIATGVIYFYNQGRPVDNNLQGITSGPFSINNGTYRLGDNVFMVVTGLKSTDVGKVVIYDPKGGIFDQFPFNGTMKSEFNYFFKPYTLKSEKLCTSQDLVGNWTIVFQGTQYKPIPFEVINQWVPGDQADNDLKPISNC